MILVIEDCTGRGIGWSIRDGSCWKVIPSWAGGNQRLKSLTLWIWRRESAELKLRCLKLKCVRSFCPLCGADISEVWWGRFRKCRECANWNQLLYWNEMSLSAWKIVSVLTLRAARGMSRNRKQIGMNKSLLLPNSSRDFLVPSTGIDLQKTAEQSRNMTVPAPAPQTRGLFW